MIELNQGGHTLHVIHPAFNMVIMLNYNKLIVSSPSAANPLITYLSNKVYYLLTRLGKKKNSKGK